MLNHWTIHTIHVKMLHWFKVNTTVSNDISVVSCMSYGESNGITFEDSVNNIQSLKYLQVTFIKSSKDCLPHITSQGLSPSHCKSKVCLPCIISQGLPSLPYKSKVSLSHITSQKSVSLTLQVKSLSTSHN